MARSVLLLLAGAVTGGAAAWLLAPSSGSVTPSGESTRVEPIAPPPAAAETNAAGPGGYHAERLAIYEQAAEATDTFEIEALIERALDEFPSRLREFRIRALLARFAELDPAGAVRFARVRHLDPELLLPLFATWAEIDAESAIDELALISPPAQRREIALAMLAVVGHDEEGIELVAAALPSADRVSFEIDATLDLAANDPARALDAYFSAPSELHRQIMLLRVAEIAARSDPLAALSMASAIDDTVRRRTFADAVVTAWAALDAEAVFAWIASVDAGELPTSQAIYQALAASDATRLYSLLDTLPTNARTTAQRAAMEGLAAQDPASAIAMLGSVPPGPDRDRMLQTIAQTYGRQNPDLAIAWARSLPSAEADNAIMSVLSGVAAIDPLRATDLLLVALANPSAQRPAPNSVEAILGATRTRTLSVLLGITSSVTASGGDFGPIADRLVASGNPEIAPALASAIGTWARQDSDAALDWALRNVDRLGASAFSTIAQAIALDDVNRAAGIMDRLPAEQRAQWVAGIVQTTASRDPQRAMQLLESIRGQPGYEEVYTRAALALASADPAASATLLRSLPESSAAERSAGMTLLVGRMARSDPAAAVDLARSLEDPNARTLAIRQVASGWAESDPVAAQRWVLSLGSGPERDSALDSYMVAAARTNRFEPQLLDAYSSPAARERGASSAIAQLGRTNLQEARRLLDLYVTDEALRRQTAASLAQTGGVGGSGSGSSVLLPPLILQ